MTNKGKNYIDDNLEAIRGEFKMLDHWVYLNAGDQMVPGNYWLKAIRDFYNFVFIIGFFIWGLRAWKPDQVEHED